MLTETLRGEEVALFETTADGWAWVQLAGDRYVGWTPAGALGEPDPGPTHKVTALRTFVFSEPDIKSPPLAALPLGARVAVNDMTEDRNARYALIAPAGAVVLQHLAPVDAFESDFTAVAERFIGTPYLWGGKTGLGLDCSGLVQVALGACGIAAPRDADMQETSVGSQLPLGPDLPRLARGDLVFWKGHVGIMRDPETLLHASAHHMAVASELLGVTVARHLGRGLPITGIRRLA
jgi:cell wall-associated NlpC family hydrolase